MALEGVDIKQLAYSPDAQVWTVKINNNKYDFYGVNPFLKRKLGQYIKYNNKKSFFDLLKRFDYVNLTKGTERQTPSSEDRGKNNGDDSGKSSGEQLSLFSEGSFKRKEVLSELRTNLYDVSL